MLRECLMPILSHMNKTWFDLYILTEAFLGDSLNSSPGLKFWCTTFWLFYLQFLSFLSRYKSFKTKQKETLELTFQQPSIVLEAAIRIIFIKWENISNSKGKCYTK